MKKEEKEKLRKIIKNLDEIGNLNSNLRIKVLIQGSKAIVTELLKGE